MLLLLLRVNEVDEEKFVRITWKLQKLRWWRYGALILSMTILWPLLNPKKAVHTVLKLRRDRKQRRGNAYRSRKRRIQVGTNQKPVRIITYHVLKVFWSIIGAEPFGSPTTKIPSKLNFELLGGSWGLKLLFFGLSGPIISIGSRNLIFFVSF